MTETPAPTADAQPLFSEVEVEQFDADDVTAGKAIGQMLAFMFLYTVIAMSLVSWWTFRAVAGHDEAPTSAESTDH